LPSLARAMDTDVVTTRGPRGDASSATRIRLMRCILRRARRSETLATHRTTDLHIIDAVDGGGRARRAEESHSDDACHRRSQSPALVEVNSVMHADIVVIPRIVQAGLPLRR